MRVISDNPTDHEPASSIPSEITAQMGNERRHITRLHIHGARPCESTGKTLTCTPVGNDTTGSNTFDLVTAVPCHQMAIIHVVRFIISELKASLVQSIR